jgi:23S rRNA U2552 (ribose-2'-O)-methylase RlmE/FtsJ
MLKDMFFTINFPTFFAKGKEILGIDLQPIVIPLLVRLVKSEVERSKKAQELKLLTEQGELDLKNFTS